MANNSETRTNPQQTRDDQTKGGSQQSNMGEKGSQTSNTGNSGSTSSGSTSQNKGGQKNQPTREDEIRGGQHSGGQS